MQLIDKGNSNGKLVFIVNPTSGKGRTALEWSRLRSMLDANGVPYIYYMTEGPGHAKSISASLEAETRAIISVGGDGTLNEVINGLAARWLDSERMDTIPIPVGLIPTGSGNDYARTLRLPKSSSECLKIILNGGTHTVDLGKVADNYFINVSGAGFDAEVVSRFNKGLLGGRIKGSLGYLASVFATLLSFKAVPVTISLDNENVSDNILLIAVGNGRYYGGGMEITPGADPSDGLLDVLWVQGMPIPAFLASLASVFTGRHITNPKVRHRRARHVEVTADERVRVQADGEIIGTLPMVWSIVPGSLRILWL